MQASQPAFTSCPWCGTGNSWGTLECRRCGGSQPAVELLDPGPRPPSTPRIVPRGYQMQLFITEVTALVGAIFVAVGLPFLIVFPIVGLSTGLMAFLLIGGGLGGLFVGIGSIMVILGLSSVRRKAKIYRMGQVATGTVTKIGVNHSIAVNGRHPWRIDYVYNVFGVSFSGIANSWHPTVEEGSPLHVLYLSADPGESALFPPLSARKP